MGEARQDRLRRLLVVQLYVACLLSGVVQIFTENAAVYWMFALFVASTVTWWTALDARSRGRSLLHVVQLLLLLLWPIAVPVYLVWTRGIRGLGWSIMNAIGLMAVVYLGFYGTAFAVYGMDAFSTQQ